MPVTARRTRGSLTRSPDCCRTSRSSSSRCGGRARASEALRSRGSRSLIASPPASCGWPGRARDIVRDLLHFSRQREFIPQITDLNTVLEQTLSMVRRQGALDAISLREEYAPGLAPVEIDVPRIKQVFLNLINNAVYVMKDRGGSLTIRSQASGAMVQVEVTDTGTGIAPEHLDRIFEPFFTTKPEVSGTGLGLSVSLGIVQSHGGTIEVKSQLGKGSTFTVKLPAKPGATVEDSDPDV